MKKFFASLFFTGDCARGALFALTLLTIGNYLWFALLHAAALAIGRFYPAFARILLVGALLITLCALGIAGCALARLIRLLRERHTLRPLWWLLPAGLLLATGGIGFVWTFPPLFSLRLLKMDGGCVPTAWEEWLNRAFPPLPPPYWGAVFFLALILLLAGGLVLAGLFAAAEGKKFRTVFGKATLALWGVLALGYCFFLGLALYENCEAAAAQKAVEERFGRPLTAAGMEAMYRENGPIDADFWKRCDECRDALPGIPFEDEETFPMYDFSLPDRPSPETLAWFAGLCREQRAALEAWERCFDRVPPLPAYDFRPGGLFAIPLPEINPCRAIERLERNRLTAALAAGDIDTAWACYRRMGNASALLRKSPFLLGSLVWCAGEFMRLDCVEKLLASRLLGEARLAELDSDLAEMEREAPRNHRQAMYGEAALFLDAMTALAKGLLEKYEDYPVPGAFAPYRWLFPQFWYHVERDKKAILQNFLQPDFAAFVEPPKDHVCIMNAMLNPLLKRSGRTFYALTARARGMQVLLRAERYRRRHGAFPQTLDDLPEDPFTGKPLIYEVGPAEIRETVWKKPVTRWETEDVKTTLDAVQVHSDPDKTPEWKLRNPERGTDSTRALIPLGAAPTRQAQ